MAPCNSPPAPWAKHIGAVNRLSLGNAHLLACLLNLPSKNELIKDQVDLQHMGTMFRINSSRVAKFSQRFVAAAWWMHLVEIKHKVELAHVVEVVIQNLHKQVDSFKHYQLIICDIHAEREKEAGVSAVDDFVRSELQEESAGANTYITQGTETP